MEGFTYLAQEKNKTKTLIVFLYHSSRQLDIYVAALTQAVELYGTDI